MLTLPVKKVHGNLYNVQQQIDFPKLKSKIRKEKKKKIVLSIKKKADSTFPCFLVTKGKKTKMEKHEKT